MSTPAPLGKPFSFWSVLCVILWILSGVIAPCVILMAPYGAIDSPLTMLIIVAVGVNAVASIGLGLSRGRLGLGVLALTGGWFIMAALLFAGCITSLRNL